jgi:hypothetical protein
LFRLRHEDFPSAEECLLQANLLSTMDDLAIGLPFAKMALGQKAIL